MGIIGSFLDSYFSLDVVTESPWVQHETTSYLNFTLSGGLGETGFTLERCCLERL
jgi:hypothetical protein